LVKRMVIPSNLKAAREAEDKLLAAVCRCGFKEASTFAVKLALEEGLNNAIKHGNGYDASKTIEISFDVDEKHATITITDQGEGFDPGILPDPTADENLEKPCGRGIMLMRAYMDEVCYNERGNQVRLVKHNT